MITENHSTLDLPGSSAGWLISFGDLLTLLVCVFIGIATTHRSINPPKTDSKTLASRNYRGEPARPGKIKQIPISGITLANLLPVTGSSDEFELLFYNSDFTAEGTELTQVARNSLITAVKEGGYTDARIEIHVCAGAATGVEAQSWYIAASRGFSIQGQLLDAGGSRDRILFRIAGPNCLALDPAAERGVVGRVRFILGN